MWRAAVLIESVGDSRCLKVCYSLMFAASLSLDGHIKPVVKHSEVSD